MSKRALLRTVPVARSARETGNSGNVRIWSKRTESEVGNCRPESRHRRRVHRRREVLRSRIIGHESHRSAYQCSRCENSKTARGVGCTTLWKLRDNRVADTSVGSAANDDDIEFLCDELRELWIERPALGRPDASRRQSDEWSRNIRELVEDCTCSVVV